MPDLHDKPPEIRFPELKVSDLNRVIRSVTRTVTGDGVDVRKIGDRHILEVDQDTIQESNNIRNFVVVSEDDDYLTCVFIDFNGVFSTYQSDLGDQLQALGITAVPIQVAKPYWLRISPFAGTDLDRTGQSINPAYVAGDVITCYRSPTDIQVDGILIVWTDLNTAGRSFAVGGGIISINGDMIAAQLITSADASVGISNTTPGTTDLSVAKYTINGDYGPDFLIVAGTGIIVGTSTHTVTVTGEVATPSVQGDVDTNTQSFGGDKTFTDKLISNGASNPSTGGFWLFGNSGAGTDESLNISTDPSLGGGSILFNVGKVGSTTDSSMMFMEMTGVLYVSNEDSGVASALSGFGVYHSGSFYTGLTTTIASLDIKGGLIVGGTFLVALADIETGPGGSDAILGWDYTDGAPYYFNIGSNLSYDHSSHTLNATGGGGGMTIGAAVSGATANYVLYVDGSGNLANDVHFQYFPGGVGLSISDAATSTVQICNGSQAISAGDGTRTVQIGNGSSALAATDGTRTANLCYSGTAATFGDGSTSGYICPSATGDFIQSNVGNITVPGTSSNTFKWASGTSAPTPQTLGSLPLNVFGQGTITDLLGDPDGWVLIDIGGTTYKIPAYL